MQWLLHSVSAWDFCLRKGVKFEKYVSVLQNNSVKKLVRLADILKRPTYFFFFYTLHIDGTNHRTNGINSQTILKFNEFSCNSHTGHRLHQRMEAMLHNCS